MNSSNESPRTELHNSKNFTFLYYKSMKTKILAGVVLVTLATAGTFTYAASTTGTENTLKNTFRGMYQTGSGGLYKGHQGKMEAKGIIRGERLQGWGK